MNNDNVIFVDKREIISKSDKDLKFSLLFTKRSAYRIFREYNWEYQNTICYYCLLEYCLDDIFFNIRNVIIY